MEAEKINVKTFIVAVAAVTLVEAGAHALAVMVAAHPLIATGAARCIEIAMLTVVAIRVGGGLSSIGLGRGQIVPGIVKGCIWAAGFGCAVIIVGIICALLGYDPMRLVATRLPGAPGTCIAFVLIGALIAPIAEEMFFRGVLYGFFRRWGVPAAITLSTLLFAVAHPLGTGIQFTQITGGILFAAAYEREGKLMAPIMLHVLGNAAIFAVSMMV